MLEKVGTVEAIIEAVGGNGEAASLAHVGPNAVSNWKARGSIPAELFFVFARRLEAAGKAPERALFGFADEARA